MRYELGAKLGEGGAGRVYACRDSASDQELAIKIVKVEGQEARLNLVAEFDILSRLEHPNIIKVHDVGIEGDECFLVMDLVQGPDAYDAVDGLFAGESRAFLLNFAEILDALEFIHARGLIHGDIKPSNILFGRNKRPVLVDFGMAWYYRRPGQKLRGATFKYASPEVFEGQAPDGRSDLFSIGLVLYESLTRARVSRKGARIDLDFGALPTEVAWIVKRLVARNPAERFQTAYDAKRAILETLHAVEVGEPFKGEVYLLPPGFVGRHQEIADIEHIIHVGDRAKPHVVVLTGPTGLGKSRIISEIKTRCLKEGIWFADLSEATTQDAAPLLHLLECLRLYARKIGRRLARSVTAWGKGGIDSRHGIDQIVMNIGMLAHEVAAHRRIVVNLDGLYPGERGRSDIMRRLVRCLARTREGNLIMLYTIDSDRSWAEEIPSLNEVEYHVIDVGPLEAEELRGIIFSMLGSPEVPDRVIETVQRMSSGNPMLARIALEWMVASGSLTRGVGRWIYSERRATRFPGEVEAAYGSLIASLKPFDRKLLGVVASLSMPCDVQLLQRLTRFSEKHIGLALLGLLKLGLVERIRRGRQVAYRVPQWIESTARRGVPRKKALEYAEKAVGMIPADNADNDAYLARLYEMLGDHSKALEKAVKAASSALAARDIAPAVDHANRALRLLKKVDMEPSKMTEALLAAGDVFSEAKELSAALSCYRRALRKAAASGKSKVLRKIGYVHECHANHNLAMRYYRRALASARQTGETETAARLENDLAWINMRLGRHRVAQEHASRVIDMLQGTDQYAELSQAFSTLGVSAWNTSRWDDALRHHRRCLELRAKAGDQAGRARTLNNIGLVLRSMGRWDEAVKSFEKSIKIKKSINDRTGLAGSYLNLAFVHFERGDLDRALIEGENAMTEANLVGDNLIYVEASGLVGEIKHAMGDVHTSEEILARAVAIAEDIGAANEACVAKRRYADLLFATGRLDEALEAVSESLRIARDLGSKLEEACCLRTLGLIVGVRDFRQGSRHLRESEEILKSLKSLFELGRTYLAQASLNTKHDIKTAVKAANEAVKVFSKTAAKHELAKAEGLLEDLGVKPRISLSDRRLETLFRIAKTVNSVLELDDLLEVILDLAIETTGAERGFILLCENGRLNIVSARNIDKDKMETAREISESVVREVLRTGEPLISVDALADPRLKDNKSVVAFNIRSLVSVPLRIKDEVVGAIYEDTRTSVGYFNRDHVDFLLAFADQAAIAMENARLYGELKKAKRILEIENKSLRSTVQSGSQIAGMVGISESMLRVFESIHVAKDSGENVLIVGESGTGKEVAARAIHFLGARKDKPFVAVNCAAIPRDLLESELFGHERGAFTGAHKARMGYFEAAAGGTLLLDEIAEMDGPMQAKLLRAIETKEFYRLGSAISRKCNVRIISTTNRNLEEEVREGRFRNDLYFRLNVIRIDVPPLRERREDIPVLVEYILTNIARDSGQPVRGISPSAVDALVRYSWPGNVRELENCMRSAWATSRGGIITPQHLPREIRESLSPTGSRMKIEKLIDRLIDSGEFSEKDPLLPKVERALIRRMVERIGEKKKSARLLGISKPTLYSKLARS